MIYASWSGLGIIDHTRLLTHVMQVILRFFFSLFPTTTQAEKLRHHNCFLITYDGDRRKSIRRKIFEIYSYLCMNRMLNFVFIYILEGAP